MMLNYFKKKRSVGICKLKKELSAFFFLVRVIPFLQRRESKYFAHGMIIQPTHYFHKVYINMTPSLFDSYYPMAVRQSWHKLVLIFCFRHFTFAPLFFFLNLTFQICYLLFSPWKSLAFWLEERRVCMGTDNIRCDTTTMCHLVGLSKVAP